MNLLVEHPTMLDLLIMAILYVPILVFIPIICVNIMRKDPMYMKGDPAPWTMVKVGVLLFIGVMTPWIVLGLMS